MKQSDEFERFDSIVRLTLSVSHEEMQKKLKNEKPGKRRRKSKGSSASREEDGRA